MSFHVCIEVFYLYIYIYIIISNLCPGVLLHRIWNCLKASSKNIAWHMKYDPIKNLERLSSRHKKPAKDRKILSVFLSVHLSVCPECVSVWLCVCVLLSLILFQSLLLDLFTPRSGETKAVSSNIRTITLPPSRPSVHSIAGGIPIHHCVCGRSPHGTDVEIYNCP